MLPAVMTAISVLVCMVALPRCGMRVQLGRPTRGWQVGRGSGVITSKPAAKISFSFKASTRSS